MQASTNIIVIKDSCTIIDHCELGLLDEFFRLKLLVYTTPNVIVEITDPDQTQRIEKYIESGHLKVDGEGDIGVINQIARENPALSVADSSVLELAMRLNATVLTSDGSLRKISQANSIQVRGSLWVIEEMVLQGVINKGMALEKLEQYPKVNKRAPKIETTDLINRLKQINS